MLRVKMHVQCTSTQNSSELFVGGIASILPPFAGLIWHEVIDQSSQVSFLCLADCFYQGHIRERGMQSSVVIDVATLLLCTGPGCSSQAIYDLAKCVCDS